MKEKEFIETSDKATGQILAVVASRPTVVLEEIEDWLDLSREQALQKTALLENEGLVGVVRQEAPSEDFEILHITKKGLDARDRLGQVFESEGGGGTAAGA